MTSTSLKRRGLVAALLTATTLALTLSGCSTAAPGGNGELQTGDAKAAYAEWNRKFTSCMKNAGFDPSKSTDPSDAAAAEKATKDCVTKVGKPPVDPDVPSNDEINAQMLAFAKCMRKAGYDYPDPKIDPNGGVAMGPAMPSDWNPADIDQCSKDAGMGANGSGGK